MYQRIAYFVGKPTSPEFVVQLELVFEGFATLPGLRDAKLTYAEDRDANAIDLYASIQLTFETADSMRAALATPERHVLRDQFVTKVIPLFSGEVFHINQCVK